MKPERLRRFVRWSCMLTLLGLVFCGWALFDPKPIPVIMSMSVAQGIGLLALFLYVVVLFFDLRLHRSLPQALSEEEHRP